MKYCTSCGAQLTDDCIYCTSCGAKQQAASGTEQSKTTTVNTAQQTTATTTAPPQQTVTYAQPAAPARRQLYSSGIGTAIKIFMIISCIAQGWMLIPLAWCIPMTVSAFNAIKENRPMSMALKVCTLLFVNTIAGIMMLTVSDN